MEWGQSWCLLSWTCSIKPAVLRLLCAWRDGQLTPILTDKRLLMIHTPPKPTTITWEDMVFLVSWKVNSNPVIILMRSWLGNTSDPLWGKSTEIRPLKLHIDGLVQEWCNSSAFNNGVTSFLHHPIDVMLLLYKDYFPQMSIMVTI